MMLSKEDLALQRAAYRSFLSEVGIVTARFQLEVANDGVHQAFHAALADASGRLVSISEWKMGEWKMELLARFLRAWVDTHVPGWEAGDGGRSQFDWAVETDALQHQHFDNVKFERRRLLAAASDMNESSNILADNARTALLLAMGDLAPTDKSAQQYLRDGARTVIDQTRTDQARFLSDEQRNLLIEGIAGTRVRHGSETEWITDVVWHGYIGYEQAPDIDLVQKLATETLDDVVEGIVGPSRITSGSEREQKTRQALVDALTLPKCLEALNAVAEAWGEDMLLSLPEVDEDEPEVASKEAPTA
ncbi:hypothetical protein LJR290_007462 [Variovorax sp. LjRoot290]|uniref:hypothetical protein n=1 Tax=Variovorax sp. LjRoot290 TaxID=3342316 RepID=UPI003ED11569